MSEDFTVTQLAKLAIITMGQSPGSERYNQEEHGLPFLQGCAEFGPRNPKPAIFCHPPLRIAKQGSILVSVRAPVGTMNMADQDYCIGRGLGAIQGIPGVAIPYFLYYAIKQHIGVLQRRSQGSTFLAIGSDELKHLLLPKLDITIQERIARILSTLDKTIEKTESLIAKYQQIKAGLMHDLFTRGVTVDGKLRPPREQAPELYKETPIGWIPKEWIVGLVKDCGSVQLGRQRSPNQLSGRWTTPYLRVANVFDGYIDYSDILEMDFKPVERDTFSVRRGDILLNEGQSLELVGRCAMYDGPENTYCFQNTIVRFRAYKNHMPNYYRYLFKWWLDCGRFMTIAKQTTSVAHLGAGRFAKFKCPILDEDEQKRIGGRLTSMQSLIWQEECHAAKLRQQKSGLMHDLLTGLVRVPQNKVIEATP